MEAPTSEELIEIQRQDWNRVAPGWEKWDALLDRNMTFINYRLVAEARLYPGHRVLDLGCGTGYPSLLAAQAAGKEGRVIGLDLAEGMLAVARRKAERLGLDNLTFQTGDVTSLSAETESVDSVISRFCLMFLPDVPKAVSEIARVLKPGGYLAAAVWSAMEKNPFISLPMEVLSSIFTLPPPDPEQPGVFRLARPGDLLGMVHRAGLTGLTDEEVPGESYYESPQEYFSSLMEIAAPVQRLFSQLSPAQQKEAEAGIMKAVASFRRKDRIVLPMAIRLVVARKPYPA